ncbi:MAG: aminoglycoside phosphotransferase family protein [Lachnospiraceae bacterium]|nr:aminoglycoside phosphotransferase family protein [Lachnospiraceae bacterium]
MAKWMGGIKGVFLEPQALERIIRNYIDASPEHIEELDAGHINRSFLVVAGDKYVLQELNRKLYSDHLSELENNYGYYRKACQSCGDGLSEWQCPEWIKSKADKFFYTDESGDIWRLYNYIQGDLYAAGKLIDLMAAGEGLGRLHRILKECPKGSVQGVFRHLHDLEHYYREYREQDSSVRPRDRELDEYISGRYEEFSELSVAGGDVIHGDAKLGNMIFRNGKAIGFIDLDTIMEGSRYDDMADCLRSCSIGDDEEKIRQFLAGYEAGSGTSFTADEINTVAANCRKNRFMLGMRYYTDCLAGNVYFRESYPGESLEKAKRNLLF